ICTRSRCTPSATAPPASSSGQPGSRPEGLPSARDHRPSSPMSATDAPTPITQIACRECASGSCQGTSSRAAPAARRRARAVASTSSCSTRVREKPPRASAAVSTRALIGRAWPAAGEARSTSASSSAARAVPATATSTGSSDDGPLARARGPRAEHIAPRQPAESHGALSARDAPAGAARAGAVGADGRLPGVMSEIEIGRNKRGRRSYSLDDVAVVPSRRTRDPADVATTWQVAAYHFDIPIFAAPMDSLLSPETAIELGRLGGLGVLDLEGLWTRDEDPTAQFARIADASDDEVVGVMRSIYDEPVKAELIRDRLQQLRDAGVTAAGALSPQRTQEHWKTVVDAGVDLFFIRGTTVSAEHVSTGREPLNLKRFIYELDVPVIVGGCATYTAALHLMRTGAAGVLVGFGGGASQTTEETLGISVPLASAVADVAAARRDYMDESGGRYVHVIADGGLGRSGDLVKAIACGADGLMVGAALARAEEAPG